MFGHSSGSFGLVLVGGTATVLAVGLPWALQRDVMLATLPVLVVLAIWTVIYLLLARRGPR
jgi:hypothetical protein